MNKHHAREPKAPGKDNMTAPSAKELFRKVLLTWDAVHTFYVAVSGDLVYGGVFIVSDPPPRPGTELGLVIILPDGGRIVAKGVVRWFRTAEFSTPECPPGCGVAFTSVARNGIRAAQRYIARQAAANAR